MPETAKILVIRFSAMGDVAMTSPVLKDLTEAYPHLQLVVVSRPLFKPFFEDISNLTFYPFDPSSRHKGFTGLLRLFSELKAQNISAVADLHNNLRSTVLTTLFSIAGIKSVSVDKGRQEKRQLTRKTNKILVPLELTVQRYADVFKKLGFPFNIKNTLRTIHSQTPSADTLSIISEALVPGKELSMANKHQKWIGVSPFAQHLQKVYPVNKMESVILSLAESGNRLFIFGGSAEEQQVAEIWASKHENIISLVRKIKLDEELKVISNLDVMLSMDSSGMHLASLMNIPVVSVWGATHPYAGFLGYGQSINDAVQLDLYCRPCSIYGNVPCYRGDFACMNNLTEKVVVDKVLNKLENQKKI